MSGLRWVLGGPVACFAVGAALGAGWTVGRLAAERVGGWWWGRRAARDAERWLAGRTVENAQTEEGERP